MSATTPSRTLLLGGQSVNAIAVGTLAWAVAYPSPALRPSDNACREMLHAALALNRDKDDAHQVFDCADTYSPNPPGDEGYMEDLIGSEVGSENSRALLITKGGMRRIGVTSSDWRPLHSSPDFKPSDMAAVCRASCARFSCKFGGQPLFLYQIHHMSDQHLVSVIRVLNTLQREEKCFLHLGLCNIKDVPQLQICLAADASIVSVQNKFNLFLGDAERNRQDALLDYCEAHGLIYMAYGVFGGLDARNCKVSLTTLDCPVLHSLAVVKGVSVHLLVLAWLRHRWPKACMPLIGCRTGERLSQLAEVYNITLTVDEVTAINEGTGKKSRKRQRIT